jgi:hypothetical protein
LSYVRGLKPLYAGKGVVEGCQAGGISLGLGLKIRTAAASNQTASESAQVFPSVDHMRKLPLDHVGVVHPESLRILELNVLPGFAGLRILGRLALAAEVLNASDVVTGWNFLAIGTFQRPLTQDDVGINTNLFPNLFSNGTIFSGKFFS